VARREANGSSVLLGGYNPRMLTTIVLILAAIALLLFILRGRL
jgi:hypothetical protein